MDHTANGLFFRQSCTGNTVGDGHVFDGAGFLLANTIVDQCCPFPSPQDGELPYVDGGGNTIGDWFCVDCLGDVDCNGVVDGSDLTMILSTWGSEDSLFDLNEDGVVDGADLTYVLTAWGDCP